MMLKMSRIRLRIFVNFLPTEGEATLKPSGPPRSRWHVSSFRLLMVRRSLSGSTIGGIAETQEMLDFCGEHNLTADAEGQRCLRPAGEPDVKYRFDMASLKSE